MKLNTLRRWRFTLVLFKFCREPEGQSAVTSTVASPGFQPAIQDQHNRMQLSTLPPKVSWLYHSQSRITNKVLWCQHQQSCITNVLWLQRIRHLRHEQSSSSECCIFVAEKVRSIARIIFVEFRFLCVVLGPGPAQRYRPSPDDCLRHFEQIRF